MFLRGLSIMAVAAAAVPIASGIASAAARWKRAESRSKMTDAREAVYSLDAIGKVREPAEPRTDASRPCLVLRCENAQPVVLFVVDPLGTGDPGINIRWDGQAATRESWERDVHFFPQGIAIYSLRPKVFLTKLRSAKRLRVEFKPQVTALVAEFDVAGSEKVVADLMSVCLEGEH